MKNNLEQRMLEAIEQVIYEDGGYPLEGQCERFANRCKLIAIEEIRKAYNAGVTHGFNNLDYDGNWYLEKNNLI